MLRKMKFIILIISILSLNSCAFLGGRLYDDTGKEADARLEQIIKALNNKDKEDLKKIFSEQALNEAIDFYERMDYLFDFVDDEIISWEKRVGGSSTDSKNKGKREKTSMAWYHVNTHEQKYLIAFAEWLIDTENPENVGVYMLYVIKAEDEKQFKGFGPSTRYAGIYKPEE
jgi:hypothetical protein